MNEENQNTFYIETDKGKIKATILTNFEIYGDYYCVYTIPVEHTKNYNVYCAKNIEGKLVPITDENEQNRINKIVKELIQE